MKRFFQRSLLSAVMLVTIGSIAAGVVSAQQNGTANGFRVSPVRSEVVIEKGKSQIVKVTIENPTDVSTVAKPIINDFVASDSEDGEPRLLLDEKAAPPKNDFKKLVNTISDVELGPKGSKTIDVKLTVPSDANAGGYYGAIRFAPSVPGQTSSVGLTASVGTIVLVRVPGNLTERLDLVQLSAAKKVTKDGNTTYKAKSFFTSGDVSVLTRLKNSGDIHVQPFGKVSVKNMFGKTVYTYEFNNAQQRSNVLPDSIRKFNDDLPKRFWLGRYSVEINLGYSQGSGDLISSKASFWYIPTAVLIGLILLIAALVGTGYWFIRKQKARRQHKHEVNKRKI